MQLLLFVFTSAIIINAQLQQKFPDVLQIKGVPTDKKDLSLFGFSDFGARHVISLPDPTQLSYAGAFTGPDIEGLGFIGHAVMHTKVANDEVVDGNSVYFPGLLYQNVTFASGLLSEVWLCGASSRSSLVKFRITNPTGRILSFGPQLSGDASFISSAAMSFLSSSETLGKGVLIKLGTTEAEVRLALDATHVNMGLSSNGYNLYYPLVTLNTSDSWETYMALSVTYNETEAANEREVVAQILSTAERSELVFAASKTRWDNYLNAALAAPQLTDAEKWIAVKALQTLITNWRSPNSVFPIDGLYPAYRGYPGLWAWDSYKHAYALASIDPILAENQLRITFDIPTNDEEGFQNMVADVLKNDGSVNLRDSKPPLAAWAVFRIYQASNNINFLSEIYPKLVAYHEWWYMYRDVNFNGLCEYGSTDGTPEAGKWESGMDNAARFDASIMIKNFRYRNSYSFNQESVDLNSYLYAEKLILAQIAERLNDTSSSEKFTREAANLKQKIQDTFWNEETQYFHDRYLDGKFVENQGCEGWIPLWANVATAEQAAGVHTAIMNPNKFNTHVPFPTLSADDSNFDPVKGYWRGPMWFDQAYFGIRGLQTYGFTDDANLLTSKLFTNVQGLTNGDSRPIYEIYNPNTGEPGGVAFFGWSSAHLLMLVNGW